MLTLEKAKEIAKEVRSKKKRDEEAAVRKAKEEIAQLSKRMFKREWPWLVAQIERAVNEGRLSYEVLRTVHDRNNIPEVATIEVYRKMMKKLRAKPMSFLVEERDGRDSISMNGWVYTWTISGW